MGKMKKYVKPTNNSGIKPRNFMPKLQPGMRGFFCTTNGRFRDASVEAMHLLDEYYTKLYPEVAEVKEDSGSKGIEEDLVRELEELRDKKKSHFEVTDTKIPTCLFIKTTIKDPVELVDTICKDIFETNTQKAKYLLRMIPIEASCKADIEQIKKAVESLFDRNFICAVTTFSVVINKRYNNTVLKEELISSLSKLVWDRNRGHKVSLNAANKTIIVEILKSFCGISVLTNYRQYRRYNLNRLSLKLDDEDKEGGNTSKDQPESKKHHSDKKRS